jgi:hypothetical protein
VRGDASRKLTSREHRRSTTEPRDAKAAKRRHGNDLRAPTGRKSRQPLYFTQLDPIGLAGGLNLYGFAGGDPVNYADPFGLCPCGALAGVLGAVGKAAGKIAAGIELNALRAELAASAPTTAEAARQAGYSPRSSAMSMYHQIGPGAEGNVVWEGPGGREAVYNGDALVTHPTNRGSHNFGTGVDHVLIDVIPFLLVGNGPGDTSSMVDRLVPSLTRGKIPGGVVGR